MRQWRLVNVTPSSAALRRASCRPRAARFLQREGRVRRLLFYVMIKGVAIFTLLHRHYNTCRLKQSPLDVQLCFLYGCDGGLYLSDVLHFFIASWALLYQTCLDKKVWFHIYTFIYFSVSVCVLGGGGLGHLHYPRTRWWVLVSCCCSRCSGCSLTADCWPSCVFHSTQPARTQKCHCELLEWKCRTWITKPGFLLNHLTFSWLAQLKDRPWCCFWLFSCVWTIPSFSNWTRHCSGSHGRKLPNQTTRMLSLHHFHFYPRSGF